MTTPGSENPQTALIAAAAGSVAEELRGTVRAVLAPLTAALQGVGSPVVFWGFQSILKYSVRAAELLREAGIDPTTPAARVYWPLLEGLAAEGDGEMSELWANLLANAHAGDAGPEVLPAFPRILRELTPADAAVLARLDRDTEAANASTLSRDSRFAELDQLQSESDPIPGAFGHEITVYLDNLVRLGLAAWAPMMRRTENVFTLARPGVHVTFLGRALIRACRPPGATSV